VPNNSDFTQYPDTVAEVLSNRKYKREVLKAMKRFKKSKPFRGEFVERRAKFAKVFYELCNAYDISINLELPIEESGAGNGYYSHFNRSVSLVGKLSVVTLLHEFAHALGKNEKGACSWSLNLFRRFFPRSFERGYSDGHVLRRRD